MSSQRKIGLLFFVCLATIAFGPEILAIV